MKIYIILNVFVRKANNPEINDAVLQKIQKRYRKI